jgi:hypothetical protein
MTVWTGWRRNRSRRRIWLNAWIGLVMIAVGLLFLTIHFGDSARKSAERRPTTSTQPNAIDNN